MDKLPEETLEEVRQRLEGLQSLLKFPPWVQVASRIKAQAAVRQKELMAKPLGSMEDALHLNFKLGIVAGMALAAQLPEKLVELDYETFQRMLERERDGS